MAITTVPRGLILPGGDFKARRGLRSFHDESNDETIDVTTKPVLLVHATPLT